MQILQRLGSDQNVKPLLFINDQQPYDIGPLITKYVNNIDSSTVEMAIVPSSSP